MRHSRLHGNSRRAGTRALATQTKVLLRLKSHELFSTEDLTMLIDHDNIRVWEVDSRLWTSGDRILSWRAVIGPSSTVLAHVVQRESVVDCRQSCEFHGSGVGNHIGLVTSGVGCVEGAGHRSVDH